MDDSTEEFDGPPKKKAMVSDNNSKAVSNEGKGSSIDDQDSLVQNVRKRLKEENSLQAIHMLLNAAKNIKEVDSIHNYIEAGGGPLELLRVLQSCENKKDFSVVCPIFSAVHLVLMKIMSEFPRLEQSAEEACIYLLHECTPVLHLMIEHKSPMEYKKLALSLLTAVVSLSFRLARDVLSSFTLDFKSVEHLAEQVNASDKNSVRVKFIHFVIAFMVEGNPLLIKQLLQNKGLLRLILTHMIYDDRSTIELFLTTLQEKVVSNYSIPKTTKLHAFNTSVLILLLDLYSWQGPKKWISSKRKSAECLKNINSEEQDEDKEKVRLCAHKLMTVLCTSHKQGIVFEDKLLGTSQCQNIIVRSLFKNIDMAWNDDLVKDLTLKIVTANPDLIKSALLAIKSSFEPSSTAAWLSTCSFLKKLVETVQIDTKFLTDMNVEHYLKIIMSHSMSPLVVQHLCNEKSLKHADAAVRFSCITYLLTCLQKLQYCLKYFKDNTPHDVSKFVLKHLNMVAPKIELLLSAWTMKNDSNEVEESALESPSLSEYLSTVVNALLLLHNMCPDYLHLEDTENIDITLLSSLDESDESEFGTLKLKIMRVVSILKPLNPKSESFSMALHLHLSHLNNAQSAHEAREGLQKLLLNTGCFDGAENELEIWLHCLESFGNDSSVEKFFLEVVRKTLKNIVSHFKCLVDVNDGVAASFQGKSTSTIDDVMEMLENDMEQEDKVHSLFKHSQNISPLVPAMLDLLNSKKQSKPKNTIVMDFSSSVLIYLLHFQDYPEKVELLVQKFSKQEKSEVNDFIASWSRGDIKSSVFPTLSSTSHNIDAKLAKLFQNPEKPSKLAKKVLESLGDGRINTAITLRSCLFYITQLYRHSILTSDLLETALEIVEQLTACTSPSESLVSVITSAILHPVIVNGFLPSKKNTDINFSNLLIHFINVANKCISDIDQLKDMLSPCVAKLIKYLLTVIKKKKELKNKENILSLLEALPLSADEIQLLLNKMIDTEERNYILDNWITIETLLLNKCVEKSIILSEKIASFIVTQLVDEHEGIDELHSCFLKYIERFPHYLERISDGEFQSILKVITPRKSNLLKLSQFLISRKDSFVSCLYEEESLHNMPSIFFPLLSKIDPKQCKMKKIRKLLTRHIESIHEAILKQDPWLIDNSCFISTLITKFMDNESKLSLYKSLRYDWDKVPQKDTTILIVKSTVEGKTEAVQFLSDLFPILLQNTSSSTKGYDWICQTISETIKNSEEVDFSPLVNDNLWNKIVQAALKRGLEGQNDCGSSILLMRMFRELCFSVFKGNGSDQVAEIFELTLSHSNFINVLLDSSSELKYETVSLLLTLVDLNPKVISTSHVPIFLSSYQATLSRTDQSLLELYEKNGASIWDWRPCLWGSTAANYYSVRSKCVQPLWKQPRMVQVLNLLEDDIVMNTIRRFPLERTLQASKRLEIEQGDRVYDPAFLLPLTAHLLSAGAEVQHWSMIKSGAFAIALASLACHSSDIRSAAYLVISRFHSHLSSDHKDQQLWQNFINTVREGVFELGSDHPQLPTICTTFLARSSLVLSEVENALFSPLYNFFLAKPLFSFSTVPGFLELIHSNDVRYQDHQEWILEVLRDGARVKQDVDLLFKCFALKILLNLYSFAYVSKTVKVLILQVISSFASVRDQGHILATSYGLMPWMNHILDTADNEEQSEIIKLLNKFSHYKSCSIHIKLILVSLAEKTVSPNDVMVILRTLNSNKFLYALNRTDVEVLIDTVSSIRGPKSVSYAKYMLNYGASHVPHASASDDIVLALNNLIYEWSRIK